MPLGNKTGLTPAPISNAKDYE